MGKLDTAAWREGAPCQAEDLPSLHQPPQVPLGGSHSKAETTMGNCYGRANTLVFYEPTGIILFFEIHHPRAFPNSSGYTNSLGCLLKIHGSKPFELGICC